jgi:hypothetical protein
VDSTLVVEVDWYWRLVEVILSLLGSDLPLLFAVSVFLQVMNLVDLFLHHCSTQLVTSHSVASMTMPSDPLLPTRSPWHTAPPSKQVDRHVRLEDPREGAY